MPTLDGRQRAADSVVYQHKSTGLLPSKTDDHEVCDSVPAVGSIGYEGGSLLLKPGRRSKAKSHPKHATRVTTCVESFPRLPEAALAPITGARIALAHNTDGQLTRPIVSFLEGPGANGS